MSVLNQVESLFYCICCVQLKFHAQLSWALNPAFLINSEPGSMDFRLTQIECITLIE